MDRFSIAIEPYYAQLVRYCFTLAGSKWDGEDLLQETLVKLYKRYQEGSIETQITKAFLWKVALNTWIDHCRKNEGKNREQLNLERFSSLNISYSDLYDKIETLYRQLTPKQLISLLLKDVFKYKATEVGAMLNLSETAVKALLLRARAKLKSLKLEDEQGEKQTNEDDNIPNDLEITFHLTNAIYHQDPYLLVSLLAAELQTTMHHAEPLQSIQAQSHTALSAHMLEQSPVTFHSVHRPQPRNTFTNTVYMVA